MKNCHSVFSHKHFQMIMDNQALWDENDVQYITDILKEFYDDYDRQVSELLPALTEREDELKVLRKRHRKVLKDKRRRRRLAMRGLTERSNASNTSNNGAVPPQHRNDSDTSTDTDSDPDDDPAHPPAQNDEPGPSRTNDVAPGASRPNDDSSPTTPERRHSVQRVDNWDDGMIPEPATGAIAFDSTQRLDAIEGVLHNLLGAFDNLADTEERRIQQDLARTESMSTVLEGFRSSVAKVISEKKGKGKGKKRSANEISEPGPSTQPHQPHTPSPLRLVRTVPPWSLANVGDSTETEIDARDKGKRRAIIVDEEEEDNMRGAPSPVRSESAQ